MPSPDYITHLFNFILGFFLLMGSPYFTRIFFKKCLDTESNPMAVVYFIATALSFVVYADLALIVYSYVTFHT